MFDPFWAFCDQFVSFSGREKETIRKYLVPRVVPREYRLVDLGQIDREVYFINKGCIRFYYLTDDGREITGFIFVEGMMASSAESFFEQVPSRQVLETLEDSELLVLSHEALERLYREVPAMNVLVRKLLQQRFSHAQKVVASLISHKPRDRYTSFLELHPYLEGRIPQHVLASYMGITPVSLSRIRGRIARSDED